jgi:hypothetical protein
MLASNADSQRREDQVMSAAVHVCRTRMAMGPAKFLPTARFDKLPPAAVLFNPMDGVSGIPIRVPRHAPRVTSNGRHRSKRSNHSPAPAKFLAVQKTRSRARRDKITQIQKALARRLGGRSLAFRPIWQSLAQAPAHHDDRSAGRCPACLAYVADGVAKVCLIKSP